MHLKAQLSAATHSITPEASCSADVNQCSFTGSTAAMPVYTSLDSVHSNLTMALLLCLIFSSPLGKYSYINILMYVYVYLRMYFLLPKHCSADHVWIREAEARAWHEDLVLCNFIKQKCLFEIPKTLPGEDCRAHPTAFLRAAVFTAHGGFTQQMQCSWELGRHLLLSFHFAPACSARIICTRESAAGICSFCVPAHHCHRSCLLK